MSYKCIWDCLELLMLAFVLFAVGLTGCARVHHTEIDGRPVRVTRSCCSGSSHWKGSRPNWPSTGIYPSLNRWAVARMLEG